MKTLAQFRTALMALTVVAGAGTSAMADFAYSDFSSVTGLNMVGVAKQDANRILVTPTVGGSAGAVWAAMKQSVAGGFDTTMTIHIEDRQGGGADGMALVIQNAAPTPLGGTGGGLGYARNLVFNQPGIANSFAVAIDMWDNNPNWPEPGNNHLTFQSNGLLENTPDSSASLANAGISDLSDGSTHTVRVVYAGGVMSVYLDGSLNASLSSQVNLSTLLALDNGTAWVGVTSSTGGRLDAQTHVLDAWSWNSNIPAPGAASLMAIGGLLAVRRKR
jgi:hypothetical protein